MSKYHYYKEQLRGLPYPYAALDVALFKQNIQTNLKRARDKKIRIASKSVRCVEALRMILDYAPQFQGIMTYHAREALFLAEQGFDDLLMGYPLVDTSSIEALGRLVKQGKQICLMVDSLEHLKLINTVGQQLKTKMPICIDIDLSDNYPGLRFGVWRSSITSQDHLIELLKHIAKMNFLQLDGLMGYEAQIAGVSDMIKGNKIKNQVITLLKNRSVGKVRERRNKAIELIKSLGFSLRFVNGGGTGSMETTVAEEVVTEVTVGSGFFNAHYFDNYRGFTLEPAVFYAIPVVRKPTKDVYTCHGGGFIASGGIDPIKAPVVHLPQSGTLDPLEGAGEVQTPIRFSNLNTPLNIGDPIFLRHAKSGELCERFNHLYLIQDGAITQVNTYRGDGRSFG